MKITFTREEVEDIVLAHVKRAYGAEVNTVAISTLYASEFATVSHKAPEPVAAESQATAEAA